MRVRSAVLLGITMAGVCCANPAGPDAGGVPVPLVRFGVEGRSLIALSGHDQPQQYVVRDSATMAMTWETIYRNVTPRPSMPLIDFTRNMVLVVALGARPTSGYEILLDSATLGPDGLTVYVRRTSPRSGDAASVVTQPLDAAKIRRTTGPVTFRDLK